MKGHPRRGEEATTATHYEVLGVRPDAPAEEVRRAYLALARRLHPDGTGVAGDAASVRRLQEVNAAWAVLRNPARRAAYDRELAGAPPPAWGTRPGGPPRTRPVTGVSVGPQGRVGTGRSAAPGAGGPPGIVVPAGHAPFLRLGPVLAVLAVLVGIFVFTAYANRAENVPPGDRETVDRVSGASGGDTSATGPDPRTIEVGGCVQITSVGGRLVPVPAACGQAGAARVMAATSPATPCPAPSRGYEVPGERVRICVVE